MHRYPSKENGITLVELLATLAILSIVSLLTYGVFFNGITYSKKSNEKVLLQQEMNYIVQSITTFHQTSTSYEIKVDKTPFASKITLTGTNEEGDVKTIELSNNNYEYSLYDFSGASENLINSKNITYEPSKPEPLFIKIIIRNKNVPEQKYELKTIISRL